MKISTIIKNVSFIHFRKVVHGLSIRLNKTVHRHHNDVVATPQNAHRLLGYPFNRTMQRRFVTIFNYILL